MAAPPKEIFTDGLMKLVETDKSWVPKQPGTALYLRPFVYASEVKFGVKISEQYRFVIFTGPVAELYAKPIKVKVETKPFDPADYIRDDEEAALFISDALKTGDAADVATALGTVARSRGASGLARATGLSRAALYSSLSPTGNPTLATVLAVLKELGMEMQVVPERQAA